MGNFDYTSPPVPPLPFNPSFFHHFQGLQPCHLTNPDLYTVPLSRKQSDMVLPMGYPRPVKESEATALPAWTNCLKVLLPAVWAGTYCQSCAGSSLPGDEHVVVKNQTLLERPHCLRIQRLSNKYIPWRGLTVSNFRGCLANTYVSSDQLLERPRGLHLGLALQRVPPGCWPATTCA